MVEYKINREKNDLIKFMKTKSGKKGLCCTFEGDKIIIEAEPGKDMQSQTPIPTMFKGKIVEEGNSTTISGRFSYGFYLTTLVIVAIVLIAARLAWSVYKMQRNNIILCIIVTILLILVCIVVNIKGKKLKNEIEEFLGNLDKK